MTDTRLRQQRLDRLLAAARAREATALRDLGRAISAEADASARRTRILALMQETTPLTGTGGPAPLMAAAQLRSLLAPARSAAGVDLELAAARRQRAQRAAEIARARIRKLAELLLEARRAATAEADRKVDMPTRKAVQ